MYNIFAQIGKLKVMLS